MPFTSSFDLDIERTVKYNQLPLTAIISQNKTLGPNIMPVCSGLEITVWGNQLHNTINRHSVHHKHIETWTSQEDTSYILCGAELNGVFLTLHTQSIQADGPNMPQGIKIHMQLESYQYITVSELIQKELVVATLVRTLAKTHNE